MSTAAALPRRKLPIGLQTLVKLRDQDWAESRWDWSRRHPVIRISFAGGGLNSPERLEQRIFEILDENDKPILDQIQDRALAARMREGLKALYESIKYVDEHLKFVFLTGVSKFSKVSLFSGLNNLRDITLDARWSALCSYTDADLDSVFAPELPGLDRDEVPPLVQRLQLGRPERLQPVRRAAAVRQPHLPPLLIRDRHTHLPDQPAGRAPLVHAGPGTRGGHRDTALQLRRRRHPPRGVAVSGRLPDHRPGRVPAWPAHLHAQVPESGSAGQPERLPAAAVSGTFRPAATQTNKYRSRGEPIHLIGVEFSKDARNIVGFEVETLE